MEIFYGSLRSGESMRQHFFVGAFLLSLLSAGTLFAQDYPNQNFSVPSLTKVNFTEDPFIPYFVENKGQFDQYDAEKGKNDFVSPSYGSQMGNAIVLFNGSSVQFVENIIKNKEKDRGDKDKADDPREEREFETWRQTMNFVGANANAVFETAESQAQYFTYPDPNVQNGTITANAWGKLICKEIYPGIDVEFSYKAEGGIKYSFIIHPGADASLIQIKWSGVDGITLNSAGDLQVSCENGIMTDKAPSSFYRDEVGIITSGFRVNGKTVSFDIGTYDHNRTLVIDPWVFSPALMGNNKAYDIQHDPGGNVYVYGGSNPYQLKKFTSAGAPIWTYNTAATGYYGDFVIDGAGNAFCVYGPWGDQCVKITPAGAMVWSVSQSSSREVYRVYPNPANPNQLTIMGMGMPVGLTPMVLNINMTTGAYSGPWYHPTCTAGETRGMAVDVNGDAYGLVFSTGNANAPNNLLWKVNAANTTVASVADGYLLWESQASSTDSWYSGYNGVAVGCFVYTYDGITVKKWDKTTLALMASAAVPGGIGYVTGGVCIDACGNVYVGGPNSILEYDPNLGFLTSVATTGQVYDVNLGNVPGEILGCGNGFFGSYMFPVCASSAISVTATPATCSACNGTATVTMNPAGAYTYSWSPTGGTGATASALCAGSYTVTATLGCQTYTASIVVPSGGGGLTTTAPAPTNVTCNGACNGSAAITVTSGTGPYTFTWSPAATNSTAGSTNTGTGLCAGSYTVTATDAGGCTATNTITITQPPVLTCTFSQVNPVCNGGTGTASVVASGGTGPYTYNWTPSGGISASTTVSAGNYTCTITDANGCTTTHSFTLVAPTALSATNSSIPITCSANGSASVVVSGGTGPYTYSWAPSGGTGSTATNLTTAGSYTCTITDANGCTMTSIVNVTSTGTPTVTITSSTNISCFGGNNGSIVCSVAGGTGPYMYSWSPAGGTGSTASSLTANSYTVTVTDSNGCSATASSTLTQPPALTASATSTAILCNGGTATATVTPGGGAGGFTYTWSPSGGTGSTSSAVTANTYTCTVTDANGCTITATTTITQPTAITASATSLPVDCNGNSTGQATTTASGGTGVLTYAWTPIGGTNATANSLPANTYTCTVTDANGCTQTATTTVTQPAPLTASTTVVNATCGNNNGSATVTAAGGTGPYTYSWAPSGGTGTTAPNLFANTYTVTVVDSKGCTVTATANVLNAGAPTATITASVDVLCNGGNNGSATVSAAGGTGPYTYAWSPMGGTGTTASSLTANAYTVTVTDANTCSITATVAITEPPVLTASATSTNVLCNGGNTGSATVTANGGVTAYAYSWSPSGGTGNNAPNLTANTYTCTVTDANGCTTTASATVTEPTALTTAFSQIDELCNGGNNASATVTPAGGTTPYGYAWSPSGGSGATASSLLVGTYTCTITDANACSITQSFTITEPNAIVVTLTEVDAHCGQADGSATSSAVGGTGAYSYNWMPGNINTQNLTNVLAGTYTCTVTDANMCTGTATITINNLNGVVASIASSTNILCNGQSTGAITVTQVGGNPGYTYTWSPNVSTTTSASNIAAGTYSITVTDASGCPSTTTVTLTEPPALTITATTTPSVVCNGVPVTLGSTPAGGTPAYSVMWTPINMAGNTQTLTPSASATYTATVTDANGCTATATTAVTVNDVPVPAFTGTPLSGCAPVCVSLTDQSTVANGGQITSWSWNFGDNSGAGTQQSPTHCYPNAGTYDVGLTVTTSAGCTATLSIPNYVNVFGNPVADFSATPQPATMLDPTINFQDLSTGGVSSWNWSFGDINNSSSSLQNPSFTYLAPTCYSVLLTVSTPQGCQDSASDVVCIGPEVTIYVPNAFTPDGNGTNDVFNCVQMGIDPEHFELWIFDRWGNMIFYTNDLNKGWDGKVQGSSELCQIDTYVWKIKAKDVEGASHNMIGKVSLIR